MNKYDKNGMYTSEYINTKPTGLIKDTWEGCVTTWKKGMADKIVGIPADKLKWVKDTEKEYMKVQEYLQGLWHENQ
jgi:hypothetical protein